MINRSINNKETIIIKWKAMRAEWGIAWNEIKKFYEKYKYEWGILPDFYDVFDVIAYFGDEMKKLGINVEVGSSMFEKEEKEMILTIDFNTYFLREENKELDSMGFF